MNSDRYILIKNEDTLLSFLDRLGDIYPHETYLILTIFRSKKLNEEDKNKIKNNMMYLSKYLRGEENNRVNPEKSLQRIYELEVPHKALIYNKGKEDEFIVPQKALVCYISCNPSNEIKVTMEHIKTVNEILSLIACNKEYEKNRNDLAHSNNDFRSERMKYTRHKWADFDIDLPNVNNNDIRIKAKNIIKDTFKNSNVIKKDPDGIIVSTDGGFHVLLNKEYIKGNPSNLCNDLNNNLKQLSDVKEVSFKGSNALLPLPGSLQYGDFEVSWENL